MIDFSTEAGVQLVFLLLRKNSLNELKVNSDGGRRVILGQVVFRYSLNFKS